MPTSKRESSKREPSKRKPSECKSEAIEYTKAVLALHAHADPRKAQVSRGYFKDAGEDVFLGVNVPTIRKLSRQFYLLPLADVRKLMWSQVHEERSLAHAILRLKFEKGPDAVPSYRALG